MLHLRSVAALVLVATLSAEAIAAHSLVGVWKGKVRFDFSKLPGSNNPLSHRALVKAQARLLQRKVTLTLSPNHRFVMTVSGAAAKSPDQTTNGSWSQTGDKITLLADKKGTHQNPFTIAKDGKSFSMSLAGASLTFSR